MINIEHEHNLGTRPETKKPNQLIRPLSYRINSINLVGLGRLFTAALLTLRVIAASVNVVSLRSARTCGSHLLYQDIKKPP